MTDEQLIGKRYGAWTVIAGVDRVCKNKRLLCRCDCGTEKEVDFNSMKIGDSKRCHSCSTKKRYIASMDAVIGTRFGNWIAIRFDENDSYGGRRVVCRCDCGQESTVSLGSLRAGATTNCNPCGRKKANLQKRDSLVNKKFGQWTVIEDGKFVHTKKRKFGIAASLCRCLCGNEQLVRVAQLINRKSNRCKSCAVIEHARKRSKENAPRVGDVFGLLTIEALEYDDGLILHCRCSCGALTKRERSAVTAIGGVRSCRQCAAHCDIPRLEDDLIARKLKNKKQQERRGSLTADEREQRRQYDRKRLRDPEVRRRLKERIQADPQFAVMITCRSRLLALFKSIGRSRKQFKTLDYLGCDLDTLVAHIESQFLPGMTWQNRGKGGWHVDHIRPLASFDLTDPEQLKMACHYTNLRPLWATDNMKKGALWEGKRHRYRKPKDQPLNRSIDGSMLGLSTEDGDEAGGPLGQNGVGENDPSRPPGGPLPGPEPVRADPAG